MLPIPWAAGPPILAFSLGFTRPTISRAVVLMFGAMLKKRYLTPFT